MAFRSGANGPAGFRRPITLPGRGACPKEAAQ
jgi:hypothetical protein